MPTKRRPYNAATSALDEASFDTGRAPVSDAPERSGEYRIAVSRAAAPRVQLPKSTLRSMGHGHAHATAPARSDGDGTANAFAETPPFAARSRRASGTIPVTAADPDQSTRPRRASAAVELSTVASPCEIELLDLDLDAAESLPSSGHDDVQVAAKRSRAVRFTPEPMEAVRESAVSSPSRATGAMPADGGAPESAAVASTSAWSFVATSAADPSSEQEVAGAASCPASFDPRPGIVAFAGYGLAPEKLSETPSYALHVLARRRVLHAGLKVALVRRPQDVELYRAALGALDPVAFRKGLALLVAMMVAVAGVLACFIGVLF